MRVEKVASPPLDNNAYFLFDEASRQAAVVDPALAGKELLAMSEKFGAKIVYILNTHGHPDSTADDASIRTATGAKIAIFAPVAGRAEATAGGGIRWPSEFWVEAGVAPNDLGTSRGSLSFPVLSLTCAVT